MRNNFLQKRTRNPAKVPPGGEPIVRVAESMGLCISFNCYVSKRGDGTETASVTAFRPGASCLRKGLGTLAKLSALPEEELREHIVARFRQNAAKLSLEDRADIVMTCSATTLPNEDDEAAIKGWGDYE
jgi:hypothetical protein